MSGIIAIDGRSRLGALRTVRIRALLLTLLALGCIPLGAQQIQPAGAKPAFVFDGVGYLPRWSKNNQHEFTPEGQEDLEKWLDMITMNVYPDTHDGDALAAKANAVFENYKSHHGMVLRTNSLPRTPDRPAEHFIAVVFARQNFIEAAFARFKLVDGTGCSIVYSHRIYGEKVGDQMSAWLDHHGAKLERTLMEWNNVPSPASLGQLPRKQTSQVPSTTRPRFRSRSGSSRGITFSML